MLRTLPRSIAAALAIAVASPTVAFAAARAQETPPGGAAAPEPDDPTQPSKAVLACLESLDSIAATLTDAQSKHQKPPAERRVPGLWLTEQIAVTSCSSLQLDLELTGALGADFKRKAKLHIVSAAPKHDLALVALVRPPAPAKARAPSGAGDASGETASAVTVEAREAAAPSSRFPKLASDARALDANTWTLYVDPLAPGGRRAIRTADLGELATTDNGEVVVVPHERQLHLCRALGGMAIVDRDATLVGLWSVAWPHDQEPLLRVRPASLVKELLANADPRRPIAGKLHGRSSRAIPRLRWLDDNDASPLKRAENVDYDTRCRNCKGNGWTLERRNDRDARVACTECQESSGLGGQEDVYGELRTTAEALGRNDDASKDERFLKLLEASATAAAARNPSLFRKYVHDEAVEHLNPDKLVHGSAFALVLPTACWPAQAAQFWGEEARVIGPLQTFEQLVLVAPRYRNTLTEAQHMLILGTIAGTVARDGDDVAIVLERCYVVPIKTEGR